MLTNEERFNKLIDLVTQATSWDVTVDEELQKLKYPEKPKQSTFEENDQVIVYNYDRYLAKIKIIHPEHLLVHDILRKSDSWVHIKQCRRLRKKQK